jgi:hypothetical protein
VETAVAETVEGTAVAVTAVEGSEVAVTAAVGLEVVD